MVIFHCKLYICVEYVQISLSEIIKNKEERKNYKAKSFQGAIKEYYSIATECFIEDLLKEILEASLAPSTKERKRFQSKGKAFYASK